MFIIVYWWFRFIFCDDKIYYWIDNKNKENTDKNHWTHFADTAAKINTDNTDNNIKYKIYDSEHRQASENFHSAKQAPTGLFS